MTPLTPTYLDASQAAPAQLVDLEARWANLPVAVATESVSASLAGLFAKQKTFDAYQTALVAYNQRYRPAYHGRRSVSTTSRLALWCRSMADLYRRAARAECPTNVLEQAHRCADRLGKRLNRGIVCRPATVRVTADVIAGLTAIAEWCDRLLVAGGNDHGPPTA